MGKKLTKHTKVHSEAASGASKLLREKHKAGLSMRKELEVEDPFEVASFDPSGGPAGLKDKLSHESSVLKAEWSIFGGELGPEVWLTDVKGYTIRQAKLFTGFEGESAWLEERAKVQNAILEKMAKRNIDQIVETNEFFVRGAKLGCMKILEGMTKTPVKTLDPATGRMTVGLSMKDMNEAGNAFDKFHSIYLKAMGIHPKENVGITNVINQLKIVAVNGAGMSAHSAAPGSTVTSSHTTIAPDGTTVVTEGAAPDPRLERLTYDEMFQVIEKIREAGFVKDDEEDTSYS